MRLASWGPSAVNAFSKLFGELGRVEVVVVDGTDSLHAAGSLFCPFPAL